MATAIQPQQANPQLKRLVYSKYREMLGSYNDKANNIIQSLPSYMVTEDKGFNIKLENEPKSYGAPPAPPYNGSLPTQRLQTQPMPEPPACVQNAMMTKDRKPFTYTPGGINLSEIRSPRMAKRIARNALYEGVSNQTKPSPLAQQSNGVSNNTTQLPPPLSAKTLGMPVQVFPTGPPQPSPLAQSNIPPPPPLLPMNKNNLSPQMNGNEFRKSPSPQNFEPPPMGCRPEIKIPPNPMQQLKKVAKPQPKNDFWIEEYIKEKSKSPIPESVLEAKENKKIEENDSKNNTPSSPTTPYILAKPNVYNSSIKPQFKDVNRFTQQTSNTGAQIQPEWRSQSPLKQQPSSYPSYLQQSRADSPGRFTGSYQTSNQQRTESPFQSPDNTNLQRPLSPIRLNNLQQQQFQPSSIQQQPQQEQQQQQQQTTMGNKKAQLGSLYIPPVPTENLLINRKKQQQQNQNSSRNVPISGQSTPPWLAPRPQMREVPEWAHGNTDNHQHIQTPNSSASGSPGIKLQNPKEIIIPIKLEQTPTPTKTPSTPNFGQQPFYDKNQQLNNNPSCPSSGPGYSSPNNGYNLQNSVCRNPNQFVDQGYDSYPDSWSSCSSEKQQQQQRYQSPRAPQSQSQGSGVRIIPITVEGRNSPFNSNGLKGPILNTPTVIQNDPRTYQQQNSRGNGIPNQSKSFRVLQKITATDGNQENENLESTRPPFLKQYSGNNENIPNDEMKRMQINGTNSDHTNRWGSNKSQQQQHYVHPSEQKAPEPRIYTGSAIPSRSFKILQAMTTPENAVTADHSDIQDEDTSPCYNNSIYPSKLYSSYNSKISVPNYSNIIDSNYKLDNQKINNSFKCINNKETKQIITPNIIITSSDDLNNTPKRLTPIDTLSNKLLEISQPELDCNISKNDEKSFGDVKKIIKSNDYDTSGIIFNSSKSSDNENISYASLSSDDLFSSSSSSKCEYDMPTQVKQVRGLNAIRSVTDINVYNIIDEDQTISDSITTESQEETFDSDSEKSKNLEVKDEVSVEDEETINKNTIKNISRIDNDESIDDDCCNLVTVRLPLKLSFSRSSNNENITTVVVGKSKIQDSRPICEENEENDISVTVCLPSRSNSICQNDSTSSEENEASESENSVYVTLPMQNKNKTESSLNNTSSISSSISSSTESNSDIQICNLYSNDEKNILVESKDYNENKLNTNSNDNILVPNNNQIEQNSSKNDEIKISVRDRIAIFENTKDTNDILQKEHLTIHQNKKLTSTDIGEDDSGLSDTSKFVSETDTDTENFPELRKMTPYQRAATHSRLFKLLQEESNNNDENNMITNQRKKIIHNVSITRKTKPELIKCAETMDERRKRLSLTLTPTNSIDADNLSSSNSPASSFDSGVVNDKMVNELVQSLLLKYKSNNFSNLSMEKLKISARKVLEETFELCGNSSSKNLDTTNSFEIIKTKANDIIPSKAFKNLQEQSLTGQCTRWTPKCPRIYSSRAVNKDLARVIEIRESVSPEISMNGIITPTKNFHYNSR